MCTLTWGYTAGSSSSQNNGYHIHFNRDESRLRSVALPPQIYSNKKAKYIAPIDPDALGTWIFVNNWGVSACLLNNYIDIQSLKGNRSRGLLVRDLSHIKDIEQGLDAVEKAGIENYAPFDLFLFDLKQVHTIGWNGEARVDTENPAPFKSSSGFNTEEVIQHRKEHYIKSHKDAGSLREFHRSHTSDKYGFSPCVHRKDGRTQSYTEISVNPAQASMCYSNGPPCTAALSEPLSIKLQ